MLKGRSWGLNELGGFKVGGRWFFELGWVLIGNRVVDLGVGYI